MPLRWGIASLVLCLVAVCAQAADPDEFFERQIRPLLIERCLECHQGTDAESGLKLTSRDDILKGGRTGPAMDVEHPERSLLLKAVQQRGKLKMPPDGKLSDKEIAALSQWIASGLPWPQSTAAINSAAGEIVVTAADREHWAFRPIADPVVPTVGQTEWPRTSIDRFLLAKLEAAELTPARDADRRTLLRRATYDLTGLPPTRNELRAFEADSRPTAEAFRDVVDRLLASPRYGERWGRHWLDVARFADTKDGVLMYGDDRIRPYAYTYRDYVIRAFNEDTPFDRFVHEQLAADRIEPAVAPWRLAAMGFLTLGRQYDNNVHDVIDDQIDTVSRGLMGLTVSCARCHDHKYDPIPQADYYSLYGVFASSEAPLELPLIVDPATMPGAAEFEQSVAAKRTELRQMLDQQFAEQSEIARQRIGDYLVHVVTTEPDPMETAIFFLSLAPDDLRPPIVARWRRLIAQRATPDDAVFGLWQMLMEQLPAPPSRDEPADAVAAMTVARRSQDVLEQWPQASNELVLAALRAAQITDRNDVARIYGTLLTRVYAEWKSTVSSAGTASPPILDEARRQLLDLVISPDSPPYFPKSQTRLYMSRQQKDQFGGKLNELDKLAVKSPHAPPRAMVVHDAESPLDPRIFQRGNPSRPGRHVPRQAPAILSSERTPFTQGSGRLELARATTAADNPLTARVIVNRVWMHHFQEPLVDTPSDFGRRSTPPSHPELLDHLATRFMNEGWSLKWLHRWIMDSRAYQQASSCPPEQVAKGVAVDPDNRWLWRMNRRRLEFESMRDTLLALSGRLEPRSGGRPVDIMANPASPVRTVYALVDRQSLPGMFRAFDFASPDQSVERRPRTMVPQQALFALNAPFVAEQAKGLAARTKEDDAGQHIIALFQTVLLREPTREEAAAARNFLDNPPDTASQLTPLEQLAQVLLWSNELMYVD